MGIGMVFQHFSLFEALTVLENIALGLDERTERPDPISRDPSWLRRICAATRSCRSSRTGGRRRSMPPFNFSDTDLTALVASSTSEEQGGARIEGNRRTVEVADLQTGNAQAGQQYFNGAGGCAKCHSATGDLAGVAEALAGLALFQRMLNPRAAAAAARRRVRRR